MEQLNSCDPGWHDYVMSLFTKEELVNGYPNVAGLRRISELLIGPIISSRVVNYTPCPSNNTVGRSTVHYEVQFLITQSDGQNITKTFSDIADSWHGNTDDQFLVYAPAIASTRAEARCLRKALKLRLVAAEELSSKDPTKFVKEILVGTEDERVTPEQKTFLDLKCRKNNINVIELLKLYGEEFNSVDELKREYVAKVIKELDKLVKNDQIPERLKGYFSDWK